MDAYRPHSTLMITNPPVSICLPVYNGQRFVAAAIESHLKQTFPDFELIISDNASTDATEFICRDFARRDARIRYVRNPVNLGCAPNFNRAFEFVRGKYIRWAAHDDMVAPTHLAKCVAALDANPDAMVAHPQTCVIDETGTPVDVYDADRPPHDIPPRSRPWQDLNDPPRHLDDPRPSVRYSELLLRTLWCFEIYGLMRTDLVRRTPLHGSFYGSDKVLLAYLILSGRFVEIPEPLFLRRAHAGSSMHFKTDQERESWIATQKKRSRLMSPRVSCFLGYCDAIRVANLGFEDKLNCSLVIARWLVQWKKIMTMLSMDKPVKPSTSKASPSTRLHAA